MTKQTKPKTKKAQLIQLLTRKAGADVPTISDKLGWQSHTTRAALTGLRKDLHKAEPEGCKSISFAAGRQYL